MDRAPRSPLCDADPYLDMPPVEASASAQASVPPGRTGRTTRASRTRPCSATCTPPPRRRRRCTRLPSAAARTTRIPEPTRPSSPRMPVCMRRARDCSCANPEHPLRFIRSFARTRLPKGQFAHRRLFLTPKIAPYMLHTFSGRGESPHRRYAALRCEPASAFRWKGQQIR